MKKFAVLLAVLIVLSVTACGPEITQERAAEIWQTVDANAMTAACIGSDATVVAAPFVGGCVALVAACKLAVTTGQELPGSCLTVAELYEKAQP